MTGAVEPHVRVYVPSTLPALAGVLAGAAVGPAPVTAFAVTPALREWYASGDTEELEYAALSEAARASLRLIDADDLAPRRRVVLAADVPATSVRWAADLDRAVVTITTAVPLSMIQAGHVDGQEAETVVAAAADAIVAADLGSDDAQFTVDEAEGYELLWYATQELPTLL